MRQNYLRYVRNKRLVYDHVIIWFKHTQEVFTDWLKNSNMDRIMEFPLYLYRDNYVTFHNYIKTTLQYYNLPSAKACRENTYICKIY